MKRGWILALVIALLAGMTTPALAAYGAVANEKVTLYKNPDLTGADGSLPKYAAVVVGKTQAGVACIRYDGDTRYVPEAALSTPWEEIEKAEASTWAHNRFLKSGCYAYARPTKDSERVRLKRNMVVWAVYEKDEWTLVTCNGYYGYIKTKYLEQKAEQKAVTKAELDRLAKKEAEREAAKLAKQKAEFLAAQEKARAAREKAEEEARQQEAQQVSQEP